MASYLTLSQISIGALVGSDCSQTRSRFKTNINSFNNVNLVTKSRGVGMIALKKLMTNNGVWQRNGQILCMSTQEAAATTAKKTTVSPLTLEDAKEPPLDLYKPDKPYTATVVSLDSLVGPKATSETYHIVINHGGNVPYWEGQNYGVIPPGGSVSLYSIASSRYGDYFDGKTASFCVLRSGATGNYLTNLKPGDEVQITGPTGKTLVWPGNETKATHIMIATGTGIAPFRGYLRRLFAESIPTFNFGGLAWLFAGVENQDSLLYDSEFTNYLNQYPHNFRYDTAQENYNVQDKVALYGDQIFDLLDNGAYIYFSGLKAMMPGIQETLKNVAQQRGVNWENKLSQLKSNGQWHVQVY